MLEMSIKLKVKGSNNKVIDLVLEKSNNKILDLVLGKNNNDRTIYIELGYQKVIVSINELKKALEYLELDLDISKDEVI